MVIKTESPVGYNNQLKKAVKNMKLGINDSVNKDKKAALRLMDGGPSKVNPPNSHPSNLINKAATAEAKKKIQNQQPKLQQHKLSKQKNQRQRLAPAVRPLM